MLLAPRPKIGNAGFSMIEVLVVVAIIAVMAAIAIPQYQSMQAKAQHMEVVLIMNTIEKEMTVFYSFHDRYPPNA